MIDGTYEFSAKTPLGKQHGTIEIVSEGDVAHATIRAGGHSRVVDGTLTGSTGTFAGEVKLPFPLGKVQYTIDGKVEGDTLTALFRAKRFKFKVVGTKVA